MQNNSAKNEDVLMNKLQRILLTLVVSALLVGAATFTINDITEKTTPVATDEIEMQETGGGSSKRANLGNVLNKVAITRAAPIDMGGFDITNGGTFTATSFVGAVGAASQITVADTTDTTTFCVFTGTAVGDEAPLTDSSGCTYNATTGVLSTDVSGALTGNADTVTTNANLTGDVTSLGNATTLGVLTDLTIDHTAASTDDHALEVDVDAAGFGDVKAINIEYVTGALAAGSEEGVLLINIDENDATGGTIHAIEVLATSTGSATVQALKVGAEIDVIDQASGTFGNGTSGLVLAVDRLTEFNSNVSNIVMFVTNSDTITIGHTSKYSEIEIVLDTAASGAGVKPTFEYSTGIGGWAAFTPIDGTNGFRTSGVVDWDLTDISGWNTGLNTEYLIRITRTQGGLSITPIEELIQVVATTLYSWDKDGVVIFRSATIDNGMAYKAKQSTDSTVRNLLGFSTDTIQLGALTNDLNILSLTNIDISSGTGTNTIVEIQAATGRTSKIRMAGFDVDHPVTGFQPADVYLALKPLSVTNGGANIVAISDTNAQALVIQGQIGAINPTDTIPAIQLRCGKSDGATGVDPLAAAETCFQVSADDGGTDYLTIVGSGAQSIVTSVANTAPMMTFANTSGDFEIFRTDATPEASVTGSIGDLAIDGTGGDLYIKNTGNATNTGWVDVGAGGHPVADSTSLVTFGTGKEMRIDVGAVTDSTVRVLTMPDTNVDLADIATNSAKVTNATHTGDVTGSAGLTISAGAVDVAMLADGTDGELITWSATGVAAVVTVGTVDQVLTSGGIGVAPTFQDAAGGSGPTWVLTSDNICGGDTACDSLTTGNLNTVLSNTGGTAITDGDGHTFMGSGAGAAMISADNTTAVGRNTLTASIAANNVGMGAFVLDANIEGFNNSAFGTNAGGAQAGTGDDNNTWIGYDSGKSANGATLGRNLGVGSMSCDVLTTGDNNICIGFATDPSAATAAGQIVIGALLTGGEDNQVTIGNATGNIKNEFDTDNAWTQASDIRKKRNIHNSTLGLDFINALRPVTYQWRPASEWPKEWGVDPETAIDTGHVMTGLVAQEVKAALDIAGVSTFAGWSEDSGGQRISKEMYVFPLIKSVQELTAQVRVLQLLCSLVALVALVALLCCVSVLYPRKKTK